MRSILMVLTLLCLAADYKPELLKDAVKYEPTKYTQALSRLAPYKDAPPALDVSRILQVKISDLPNTDWHQSGGMFGIKDVTTEKYRVGKPVHKMALFPLEFEAGGVKGIINESGVSRSYPNGTRFDDILYHKGKVFEHRVREKDKGEWHSYVAFKDVDARPTGYTGLKVSCGSCHDKAGTGGYATGLVPGGDTVFSDPLDWSVIPNTILTK